MSLSEWTSDFKRLVTRSGDGYFAAIASNLVGSLPVRVADRVRRRLAVSLPDSRLSEGTWGQVFYLPAPRVNDSRAGK